jgi:hypothetical protein
MCTILDHKGGAMRDLDARALPPAGSTRGRRT